MGIKPGNNPPWDTPPLENNGEYPTLGYPTFGRITGNTHPGIPTFGRITVNNTHQASLPGCIMWYMTTRLASLGRNSVVYAHQASLPGGIYPGVIPPQVVYTRVLFLLRWVFLPGFLLRWVFLPGFLLRWVIPRGVLFLRFLSKVRYS